MRFLADKCDCCGVQENIVAPIKKKIPEKPKGWEIFLMFHKALLCDKCAPGYRELIEKEKQIYNDLHDEIVDKAKKYLIEGTRELNANDNN